MPEKDAYQRIAEMCSYPDSASFRKMIETMITPEEGDLLLNATSTITAKQLAEKLGTDEATMTAKLDNMAKRGLIFRGKAGYRFVMGQRFGFANIMHNAPEYTPSAEYSRWWRQWSNENPEREVAGWLERYKTTGNQVHRVYPARLAILSNPEIKKEYLLWYEDIDAIFHRAEIIGVVECPCRVSLKTCTHPLLNCFYFKKEQVDFDVGRGAKVKIIPVEVALSLSDDAERSGLLHEGHNSATMPGVLCNCCACGCSTVISSKASGKMHELYSPSRFQAVVDEEKCTGCQKCVERCPFEAIEMVKVPGSNKMKAKINPEECYGCGVCVIGCMQKAIQFNLVRTPDHIPLAPVTYALIR